MGNNYRFQIYVYCYNMMMYSFITHRCFFSVVHFIPPLRHILFILRPAQLSLFGVSFSSNQSRSNHVSKYMCYWGSACYKATIVFWLALLTSNNNHRNFKLKPIGKSCKFKLADVKTEDRICRLLLLKRAQAGE